MQPTPVKPECPYCAAAMRPVVMACDHCGVEVKGRFRQTQFSRLGADDLAFLESYLLADFSIKALAETSGLGYVAIRTRLDRVLDAYRKLHHNEDAKRAILERLERGEMTAADAAKAIGGL